MKNYLYILCTFLLAFAGCTKDADVEPIAPAPDENAQVVLTGFSGRGTRTGFGGAEDGAVPFLWSAGDYIWASNTRSESYSTPCYQRLDAVLSLLIAGNGERQIRYM